MRFADPSQALLALQALNGAQVGGTDEKVCTRLQPLRQLRMARLSLNRAACSCQALTPTHLLLSPCCWAAVWPKHAAQLGAPAAASAQPQL